MIDINRTIETYKKMNYRYINLESFKTHADNDRYNDFLLNKLIKYYSDSSTLDEYCQEKNLDGNSYLYGIFTKGNNVSCIIPKRESLFDEMACIHELTHLISKLNNNLNDGSMYNEVIPYFNEYDYLKSIHHFYSDLYEILRYNSTVKAAKEINEENKEKAISYIYAYMVLMKRKTNYNIKELNKINSKSKDAEKKLILKGYTI